MGMIKRGSRVMALSHYSDEIELGTVIDFINGDEDEENEIVVIYFDDFGQILECYRDEVEEILSHED